MATPSIVQHHSGAGGSVTASTGTLNVTLGAAPTVGNLLVLAIQFTTGTGAFPAPAGWTAVDNVANGSTYTRVVQSGDGTSFTFTNTSASAQNYAFEIYEVSGQDATTPVNQHAMAAPGTSTSPSVTTAASTAASCLALAFFGTSTVTSTATPQSGWTQDENPSAASRFEGESQSNTTVAAASGTAVTGSVTWSASSVRCTAAVLLIAPASGTTPTYSAATINNQTVTASTRINLSATAAVHQGLTATATLGFKASSAVHQTASGTVAPSVRASAATHATASSNVRPSFNARASAKQILSSTVVPLVRFGVHSSVAVVGSVALAVSGKCSNFISVATSWAQAVVSNLPPVNITATFLSRANVTAGFVSKAVITAAYRTKSIITALFD